MGSHTDGLTNAQRRLQDRQRRSQVLSSARPGPTPQTGQREPNGRLDRNREDKGTNELRAIKLRSTRSEREELTPIGILRGRNLITADQADAATGFQLTRLIANAGSPQIAAGLLSKTPSPPGKNDKTTNTLTDEETEIRCARASKRYRAVKQSMTLGQWYTIRSLVLDEHWGRYDTQLVQAIRQQDLHCDEGGHLIARKGTMILPAIRRRLIEIRNVLEKLNAPPERKWTELADAQRSAMIEWERLQKKKCDLDENDVALLEKMRYVRVDSDQNCARI